MISASIFGLSCSLIIINLQTTSTLYVPVQNRYQQQGRLSLLDYESYRHYDPQGPGTYAFGYDIEEPQNDNVQFRNEEKHANGSVTGSYGFVTPDGSVHITNYIADARGYRASTETRRRGILKPVKVNEEKDIADAIAAVAGTPHPPLPGNKLTSWYPNHYNPYQRW